MADGFNTNGVFKLRSESNQATLQFGAYAGSTNMTIFKGDFNSGNKPASIMINPTARKMLIDALSEVIKAAPGARFPLIFKKWNNDTKTREVTNMISVGKDDNGVMYIEVKTGASAPEKYPIRGDKNIERSGEVDTDSSRSKHEAEALLNFMRLSWDMLSIVSRFNMPTQGSKFAKGGNSGGAKPAPAASTAVADDEWY